VGVVVHAGAERRTLNARHDGRAEVPQRRVVVRIGGHIVAMKAARVPHDEYQVDHRGPVGTAGLSEHAGTVRETVREIPGGKPGEQPFQVLRHGGD